MMESRRLTHSLCSDDGIDIHFDIAGYTEIAAQKTKTLMTAILYRGLLMIRVVSQ